MYMTVLYGTVLHCTVLHYTALYTVGYARGMAGEHDDR